MNISKCASFFHDGEILNIVHKKNKIELLMKSAEIDPNSVSDIPLSQNNVLRGNLHVDGVKFILLNGKKFKGKIKLILSDNDLLHLKIKGDIVFCEIGWRGLEPSQIDFSAFEIHAEKIWWENLPF